MQYVYVCIRLYVYVYVYMCMRCICTHVYVYACCIYAFILYGYTQMYVDECFTDFCYMRLGLHSCFFVSARGRPGMWLLSVILD